MAVTSLYCPSCNNPISPGARFCDTCGTSLGTTDEAAADKLIGKFIDRRYRVETKLGEGGMGAVYQAEQVAMKRKVALKVLHPHLSADEQLIERFNREAAACSRLNHPNTITVHDFGQTDDGTLYIVMEFVEGKNLADLVETTGAMPWQRAVHIGLQVAQSLADAHEQGIVHRDLKPDNVMLIERAAQSDVVKILDFGIAKMAEATEDGDKRKALTKTGMIFGTPQYMSPEQIRGAGVDHRTDIYALGVILYQLVTGDLPFYAENPMGMLTKHLMEPPRPMAQTRPGVQVPSQLEALVFKCLEKDAGYRYQSMNEIVRELSSMANETRPGFAVQGATPAAAAFGTGQGGTNGAPGGVYASQPTNAGFVSQPPAGFGSQPSGGFAGQPSGGFAGQPSGGFGNQPSGGFGNQPSGGFGAVQSGGFSGQPPSGGFAGQVSSGGAAPASGGAGKTIAIAIGVVVVLGALGAGGAMAWRAATSDDEPATGDTTAAVTPPLTPPPLTPTTPAIEPTPALPSAPLPPAPLPPVTPPTSTPAGSASPTKSAPCLVEAHGGDKAAKATVDVAKALEARREQFSLCFASLLNKSFDGGMKIGYRWGKGQGPNKLKITDNTINDQQVRLCVETVIKGTVHPDQAASGGVAVVDVAAAGGGGALRSCKITARIPSRSKGGPKPPGWVPPPGYYPGGYGGYGGY
jgi:serine/threonine-protein kinase